MGNCCAAHLLTKVTEYLKQSKDNKVEVNKITLGQRPIEGRIVCDYCSAEAEYIVSYYG
jgi:hypothetical protein